MTKDEVDSMFHGFKADYERYCSDNNFEPSLDYLRHLEAEYQKMYQEAT